MSINIGGRQWLVLAADFLPKLLINLAHLSLRGIQRAGIVDHKIGRLDFLLVGQLRRHPAGDFLAGSHQVHLESRCETLHALLFTAGYNNDSIEALRRAGFQNQCRFDDHNRVSIPLFDFFHPLVLPSDDRGVNDSVQLGDSRRRAFCGSTECSFRQPRTIHRSIGIENAGSEFPDDFLVRRLPGLHQLVRNLIGLDQLRTEGDEHLADDRFPAGNPAGETDLQQSNPLYAEMF
jgi:hypothetical protein